MNEPFKAAAAARICCWKTEMDFLRQSSYELKKQYEDITRRLELLKLNIESEKWSVHEIEKQ